MIKREGVSVIMLLRQMNPFHFLTALRSVYAQTYPKLEAVLVYTRGSLENTSVIGLDNRFGYLPDFLIWAESPSDNEVACFNLGVQRARGIWITCCGGEDYLLPNKIELELENAGSAEAVFGAFFSADKKLNICGGATANGTVFPLHEYGLFRRELLSEPLRIDLDLREALGERLTTAKDVRYLETPTFIRREI